MENAASKPTAPDPGLYLRGEAAKTEMETTAPSSSEPKTDSVKPVLRPIQAGIVLPVVPFYVRNNAPDLQEFLIF